MSYYAVDLYSLPAGSPGGGAAIQAPPVTAKTPPQQAPVPAPPEPEERKPVSKEAIRVPGKVKHRPPPTSKPKPVMNAKLSAALQRAMQEAQAHPGTGGQVPGPMGVPGGGAGVSAEAGPTFPYPWYLKQISEKLDKQWHPPKEFQSDTVCEVVFSIARSGEVSDSSVEKASGDSLFDQLALRAVLYANPLPPLPSGFPEDTLKVHMKFVGKPL